MNLKISQLSVSQIFAIYLKIDLKYFLNQLREIIICIYYPYSMGKSFYCGYKWFFIITFFISPMFYKFSTDVLHFK